MLLMPRQSSVALFLCASAGAALLLSGCSSATQELEKAFDSRVNIEPVRCASPEKVEREYKGITLHFDELLGDDGKKKKN